MATSWLGYGPLESIFRLVEAPMPFLNLSDFHKSPNNIVGASCPGLGHPIWPPIRAKNAFWQAPHRIWYDLRMDSSLPQKSRNDFSWIRELFVFWLVSLTSRFLLFFWKTNSEPTQNTLLFSVNNHDFTEIFRSNFCANFHDFNKKREVSKKILYQKVIELKRSHCSISAGVKSPFWAHNIEYLGELVRTHFGSNWRPNWVTQCGSEVPTMFILTFMSVREA